MILVLCENYLGKNINSNDLVGEGKIMYPTAFISTTSCEILNEIY